LLGMEMKTLFAAVDLTIKAFAPSRELNRVADFLCALYCNSCSMMYCLLPYVLFSSCAGKPLKFFMSCSY
jgi:hypothetical protein